MRYTVEVNTKGTFWHKEGTNILHREDGPAVEYPNGTKEWYLNDKLHRTDGPAVEYPDGTKRWYLNGKRHRTDGPAFEWSDGTKQWCLNGKFHREDGPACEFSDGTKVWYLNGEFYSEEEHRKKVGELKISCDNKIIVFDGKKYKLVPIDKS